MSATAIPEPAAPKRREVIYRHTRIVRIAHWLNALCFAVMLMSGLQIFNAHPALYWGQIGSDADPTIKPFLEITSEQGADGKLKGVTRLGPLNVPTTGVLGVSTANGEENQIAFPAWITAPSTRDLAAARSWHFLFAWGLVINGATYLVFGFLNRHFQRDITPKLTELKPRHLLKDIWDHARLRHATGDAAKPYNTLQKLSYLSVIFLLLPAMILTGLTMSPGVDAFAPILLDLFGGRQSARSIHFICANLLVLFLIVHLVEVIIAGAWNEIRSMITGRWSVPREKGS